MPWAIFNRPSIQLGSLKSYLNQSQVSCTVECLHPYLDVAAAIGFDDYRIIAESPWAAEALYCSLLFPELKNNAGHVFASSLKGRLAKKFAELRTLLKDHHEQWCEQLDFSKCKLVGFSVCFSQLPASLYAARLLKKQWPELAIVFGGSTCTNSFGNAMPLVFPEIDYIITGEGEQPLTALVDHLLYNAPLRNPAVYGQGLLANTTPGENTREIPDLATLPVPDYSSYFQHIQNTRLDFNPVLPVEFSRGCWWNKCTFCNLNLQWHGYRFKRAQQMLAEIDHLCSTYNCIDFTFCDNSLPVKESDLFFTAIAKNGLDLRFFAEIRPLKKRSTYRLFRQGGLNAVQIGIEALSDSLLARMHKGTTVLDNIAAMKFAQETDMTLDANLILEFPGSTALEVEETLRVLDKVLPYRPLSPAGFFLGQGSPVWCRPQDFGITQVSCHPNNSKLYPQKVLNTLEMLIQSYRGDRTLQKARWKAVRKKIGQWQAFHASRNNPEVPPLSYRDGGSFLVIRQELPDSRPLQHRLKGLSRKIYLACDTPVSRQELLEQFPQVTERQLTVFLADLDQKNLLFSTPDANLALAIHTP